LQVAVGSDSFLAEVDLRGLEFILKHAVRTILLPTERHMLSAVFVIALAASEWPPPAHAGAAQNPAAIQWAPLEGEGDRWRARAEPGYRRALEAWEMAQRFAEKVGDPAGTARARRARAALLLQLLDAQGFSAHVEKEKLDRDLAATPLTVDPKAIEASELPSGSPDSTADGLRELVRFLGDAGRAYFRVPDREPRDLPLLFEALATAERLVADLDQVRGDAAYRRALEAARSRGSEPEAVSARLRLAYKLRDFAGASASLAQTRGVEERLAGVERVRFVRIQRDLALAEGKKGEVLALNRRLLELGEKAEEVVMPIAPLRSFVAGTTAELTRIAAVLEGAARSRILAPRERLLVGSMAAHARLEAGEAAAAAEGFEGLAARSSLELLEDDPWLRAGILARLGLARERTGDHEQAVESYRGALDALSELSGPGLSGPGLNSTARMRGRIALDAAAALFGLGDLEAARLAALSVVEEKTLPVDLRLRGRILLAGIVYQAAGDDPARLGDARAALEEAERQRAAALAAGSSAAGSPAVGSPALGTLRPETSEELRAIILSHLGNVHRRLARDPKSRGEAIRCAREALAAAEKLPGGAAGGFAANLGELELEAGELAAAKKSLAAALDQARARGAFETEWRVHWYLSRLAEAEKDDDRADRELEEAARIVEMHRGRILDAGRKAGFMGSKVGLYEAIVRRALDREDGARAFFAAERSRARSFVESLGLRFLLRGTDPGGALYREYISLVSRAELKAQATGHFLGIRSVESYEDLRARLDALRRKIQSDPGAPAFVRALVEGEPAGIEEVRKDLLPGERLIEFSGAEDRVAAFVASSDSFRAVRLDASRREIDSLARKFSEGGIDDPTLAEKLGDALFGSLIREIESGPAVENLVIVPWGELHRVPFESLRLGGRYLVERFAVSYLPAASVLKYLEKGKGPRERPSRLIAFVDPDTDYNGDGKPDLPALSGARGEIEGIGRHFRDKEVLMGRQASEVACGKLIPGREVVHLACHGEFFPARPLDSRLYLSRGDPADGLLRASEVFGIDLRGSRLVALSGCETGRSAVGAGEDPVGIGASFLHCGAGALLVSLWKVEDQATAEVMKNFYGSWLSGGGMTRAQALREAKLALLRNGKYRRPRQWAAFIMIGPR